MNIKVSKIFIPVIFLFTVGFSHGDKVRSTNDFNKDWKFYLGDEPSAEEILFDDSQWRMLDLPHDWSIEGEFNKDNPATIGGGALPGGIGWYRKSFTLPEASKDKLIFIEFDGIYRNSEVWINEYYLGKRPYGYISFRYELTPYLKYGSEKNIIAVKVDNSLQPNSRWYSGSGIYRNVRLVTNNKVYIDNWGTFITTPDVNKNKAILNIKTSIRNSLPENQEITLHTSIYDNVGNKVTETSSNSIVVNNSSYEFVQDLFVETPLMWSIENPNLYHALSTVELDGKVVDDYETRFGIRTFHFDKERGFFLNEKPVKINGVCNHHDLGCLGAAVNTRAIERQLEIMKEMGVNAIRTSHNPPAPELLDLCDSMGFIVMNEAFDVWKKKKTDYDYSLDWDDWHKRDLEDFILRDRNHPSVFIWSIGNEVIEQYDREDSSGVIITRELAKIVNDLDNTRPITAACNEADPLNPVIKSDAFKLIGYNYSHRKYFDFPETYDGKYFISSESTSALATRGSYDFPSDSIRIWPIKWDEPFYAGNPDNTCSSYDNCHVPWGSTHTELLKIVQQNDFISGMFIWTGFDYLGEPTPYQWPSRSSYFGIVDLAGFPKDAYYLYQSEWTDKPILHLFPHWNWNLNDTVDAWVYTNCDEVELFLNKKSLGKKHKSEDDLHLMWRISFEPGTLEAVGKKDGKEILTKEIKTAGIPSKIILEADRKEINSDGQDLSFITVKVLDENGTIVPYADNLINFEISGEGKIVGVDNGLQTSHEPFKANYRKAFNGMCLAVVQSTINPGSIVLKADSDGLTGTTLKINTK